MHRRARIIASTVLAAAFVGVVLASAGANRGLLAQLDYGRRTPVPAASDARPAGSPVPPPKGRGQDFIVTPPELAGKVLHWRQTSLVNDPGGPDPANGRLSIGDIWVELDGASQPTRFHGRYTYEDGSFHQEIVQSLDEIITTFDPAGVVRLPTGEQMCTRRGPSTPKALRGVAPPFVKENAARSAGYRAAGAASPPALPALSEATVLPSAVPQRAYETPATVERWEERVTLPTGATSTTILEVAPDGRLVATSSRRTDAQGQLLGSEETRYGPLDTYQPSAVPASAFTLSRDGCNG